MVTLKQHFLPVQKNHPALVRELGLAFYIFPKGYGAPITHSFTSMTINVTVGR